MRKKQKSEKNNEIKNLNTDFTQEEKEQINLHIENEEIKDNNQGGTVPQPPQPPQPPQIPQPPQPPQPPQKLPIP